MLEKLETLNPKAGCRFCRANNMLMDEPLFENPTFFILGSIDLAAPAAVMIVSHRHVSDPFELDSSELANLPAALGYAKTYLSKFSPNGYTIGWNVGEAAGQTVQHAHLHVMARHSPPGIPGYGIRHLVLG